jgi:hypothetical protein
LHSQCSFSQRFMDFLFGDRHWIIEKFHHYFVIKLGYGLQHFFAPLGSFFCQFSRNLLYIVIGTQCLVVPVKGFHPDQINNPFKTAFGTNRYLNGTRTCAQHFFYLANHFEKIRPRTVHFIYVTNAGDFIFIGLTPYRFRLRFYSANGTKSGNCTIQYPQRTFYFNSEIHVSRSID